MNIVSIIGPEMDDVLWAEKKYLRGLMAEFRTHKAGHADSSRSHLLHTPDGVIQMTKAIPGDFGVQQ
jgi:hypothetical protein